MFCYPRLQINPKFTTLISISTAGSLVGPVIIFCHNCCGSQHRAIRISSVFAAGSSGGDNFKGSARVVLWSEQSRWNGGQDHWTWGNQGTKRPGYRRIIYVTFKISKLTTSMWLESNRGIQVLKSNTLNAWGGNSSVPRISISFLFPLYL